MGAGLVRIFVPELNGRLTSTGFGINTLIALSCLGTLVYPLLDTGGIPPQSLIILYSTHIHAN